METQNNEKDMGDMKQRLASMESGASTSKEKERQRVDEMRRVENQNVR